MPDPKTSGPPPTKEEALAELARRFHQPQPVLQLLAFDCRGLPSGLAAEAGADQGGWALEIAREHQLGPVCNFRLALTPGLEPALVLEALDALRARIAAQPELLSADWTQPLPVARGKPRLAVVPAAPSSAK